MEISPHVHQIPGVMANVFLVVEPDGLTLIDAGLSRDQAKIPRYIVGLGRRPSDCKRIIITHSDTDHVGGLAALKEATGARVYASAIEAQAIAMGRPSRPLNAPRFSRPLLALLGPILQSKPVQVDECVPDGYVFPVLGGLRVVATPGHTPGHISLFAPAEGVLFVGDSLIVRNGQLQSSWGIVCWDQDAADASVRAQAALGARIVCSGHGAVVTDAVKFPV